VKQASAFTVISDMVTWKKSMRMLWHIGCEKRDSILSAHSKITLHSFKERYQENFYCM